MFSIRAMPSTTIAKMIGANTILISLMKMSPSGFRSPPRLGYEEAERHAGEHADQHLDVELSEEAAHDLSPVMLVWHELPRQRLRPLRDRAAALAPLVSGAETSPPGEVSGSSDRQAALRCALAAHQLAHGLA